ncbi:SpoIIE family protein phosphatase [Simiduia sp. 21SJ11W-1]|uniref:SpoIIE family protein phosphatase n=1 Tax=Simiduia sp. 21SJ11W-1 TaxID=2909669 RepID=UPI00209D3323|nr:SpoIIE family protein phosphatase [Simiduia sp. 21SJ11W-1]UTA47667.1 SpoIIE family protein phosphatase [Simiduia sp. 21SJ11W-1]
MNILIIEDALADLDLLANTLKDFGYPVSAFESGEAAIEHLLASGEKPDLVLTDIGMPGMDGYEAAKKIKSIFRDGHIPIVFLTARNDIKTLKKCLKIGDDFISKPLIPEILEARIAAHLRTSGLYRTLKNQAQELQTFRARVDEEFRIVDRIFENYISGSTVGFPNVRLHMSAMSAFNGDVLLSALGPAGSFYIMIGDVTGHGLPAAVAAIPTYSTFKTMATKGLPVGTIAYEINEGLISVMPADMMMAALIMRIDKSGQEATVWSGGMPPMIVLDKNSHITQRIHATHAPLSMLPGKKFSRDIQHYTFDLGDRIYLYTDGIEEAEGEFGTMFGETELVNSLVGSVDPFESLLNDVENFRSGEKQNDDVTLLEFTCKPLEACLMTSIQKAKNIIPWHFETTLTKDHFINAEPAPALAKMLGSVNGIERHQDIISTVLSELYANALDHGLLKLDSTLKEEDDGFFQFYELRKQRLSELKNGWIKITLDCYSTDDGATVYITLQDSGEGFDTQKVLNHCGSQLLSGRGIALIKSLADELKYSNNGTCAKVRFDI